MGRQTCYCKERGINVLRQMHRQWDTRRHKKKKEIETGAEKNRGRKI